MGATRKKPLKPALQGFLILAGSTLPSSAAHGIKPGDGRFVADHETGSGQALDPIYGQSKHATTQDLANADIWKRLT
ncbi:hypothetical protein [Pseudomonas sp.]|uniref:hypothetical protein n=1 Tax=Pseudomonas sp. TaxID=306 RepID=UPI00272FA338|nr:hypothetical protein [Pseudomonas sp.]MDP2244091.1 hypothetical protein [Pseudomonas sp.]